MDKRGGVEVTMQDFDSIMLRLAERMPIPKLMAGSRMLGYFSTTIVASPAAGSETVVCTTQPFSPNSDFSIIFLVGWVNYTVGTSGVTGKLQIRRGTSASGTSVAAGGLSTVVATHVQDQLILGVDTPTRGNDFQYSMTLQVGSGAATSTVANAALLAFCT